MSSPWMPQHEIGGSASVRQRSFDRLEPLREGAAPLYAGASPAAEEPRPLLPTILRFHSLPPRQLYIGGFLVGFALSAAIGAALYLFLLGDPPS
jgi:hypothetical protein